MQGTPRSCARFAILLLVLLFTERGAFGACLLPGANSIKLPPYLDAQGRIACRPGFFCPNLDPTNLTTYPEYCPPLPECGLDRLQGSACDMPQGDFEPELCHKGHYCPTSALMLECPSRHFCVAGTVSPHKCDFSSYCPAGSETPFKFGGLINLFVASIVVAVAIVAHRRFFCEYQLTFEDCSLAASPNTEGRSMMRVSVGGPSNISGRFGHIETLFRGFERAREGAAPLVFRFENLGVSVPLPGGHSKQLLRGVSGSMKAGRVTAIMGPSGAGKTVFMSTLLGKIESSWECHGTLRVNGEVAALSNYKRVIGFVPQDDILHNELSVAKNLYYASEIRLPRNWTSHQKAVFRSAVMECLGLDGIKDTRVGSEVDRGLDNGQRKRTSIALELVGAPLAMFLDEPTSGVDSTTSLEICSILREVADRTQMTVAMVIHQPRVEIWNALDELLLLGKGGVTIYQGPQHKAKKYFEEQLGVVFPPESNPADVIIDSIGNRSEELAKRWLVYTEEDAMERSDMKASAVLNPAVVGTTSERPTRAAPGLTHGAPFLRQVFLCHMRHLEKQLFDLTPFFTEVGVNAMCSILIGWSLAEGTSVHTGVFRPPYSSLSPIPLSSNLPQLHMYTIMAMGLAAATAGVRTFGTDRNNYFRAAAAGHSRPAYFIGSILSTVYRVAYCALVYTAFNHALARFIISYSIFYLTFLLVYWATYAMAQPISMFASQRNAPLIACIALLVFSVTNGFIDFPSFLKHLSYGFYASQLLHEQHYLQVKHLYLDTLHEWGYAEGWKAGGLLLILASALVFHAMAYILMIALHRNKQR